MSTAEAPEGRRVACKNAACSLHGITVTTKREACIGCERKFPEPHRFSVFGDWLDGFGPLR